MPDCAGTVRTPIDKSRVVICGYGSLGRRLAQHLIQSNFHLVLIDDFDGFHQGKRLSPAEGNTCDVTGSFEFVQANLVEFGEWAFVFSGADAVVHFAAVNPYPEATWEESRLSIRMSANVVSAVQRAGVRRLVVASSSHVLGGYMQDGAYLSAAAPALSSQTPLRHFTRFKLPGFETDASGYATAKMALEEMCRAASAASTSLSVVVVRIGWCQPGENHPKQMTATATPTISADVVASSESAASEVARGFDNRDLILAWLHRIWLSTRDFKQIFQRAIESDIKGFLIVMGVSRNRDMRWSTEGWMQLGYEPLDDVQKSLQSSIAESAADNEEQAAKRQKL